MIEAAGSGFLIAVLWMDLIFDVQVLRHRRSADVPEPVLASIAAYYHRATTASRPMSLVIAAVMVILLAALAFHAVRGAAPGWLLALSAVLAGGPVLLALLRTVRHAVTLGHRTGTLAEQSRLARSICRDHLWCLTSMSAFLALWLSIS
ncbi:hypothetical protein TL10_20365 [Mycolicibacterium llatzerense]|uniref:Integral membrane protein n=2 Tax=Mycolicibacterium llatzerense TaxID=280871 RepID=A0A0D1J0W0_9MYCO|nr:hypothetical protein [Mycolicibacterium llatzerense]KIU15163.1 hypothetical protein TL10_20365 [Mycolicibacterium llatzerense]